MNRQPFMTSNSTFSHYDEDLDRRVDLVKGFVLHFLINKNMKRPKPSTFRPAITCDGHFRGAVTYRNGYNLWLHGLGSKRVKVEITRLDSQDQAIALINPLLTELVP